MTSYYVSQSGERLKANSSGHVGEKTQKNYCMTQGLRDVFPFSIATREKVYIERSSRCPSVLWVPAVGLRATTAHGNRRLDRRRGIIGASVGDV